MAANNTALNTTSALKSQPTLSLRLGPFLWHFFSLSKTHISLWNTASQQSPLKKKEETIASCLSPSRFSCSSQLLLKPHYLSPFKKEDTRKPRKQRKHLGSNRFEICFCFVLAFGFLLAVKFYFLDSCSDSWIFVRYSNSSSSIKMGSKWRKAKLALGLNLCSYVPRTLEDSPPAPSERLSDAALLSPTNWDSRPMTPTPSSHGLRLSKSGSKSSKVCAFLLFLHLFLVEYTSIFGVLLLVFHGFCYFWVEIKVKKGKWILGCWGFRVLPLLVHGCW